ncbi:hypothetical protein NDU88_005626 [Pleurodeles waltl]|uniref:Uncharacterized protein n=1 Tax=Pleurodeles waltl TaxID=8319 RepID=A0AAV7N6E8_PLEWA|nr:hypothetical protein NDU88_005626 [Pleurodeles waltl]
MVNRDYEQFILRQARQQENPEGDNPGGDPEDIASPRDSNTCARPHLEETGHERDLESKGPPPAGGDTAQVLTEGRSGKTHYNMSANLAPSSLLQDRVTYE